MVRGAILSFGLLLTFRLIAQSPSQEKDNASARSAAPSSSGGIGFSIESEVLTYTALRSNSKAVGHEIAGYVNSSAATPVNVASDPGPPHSNRPTLPGVVILSSSTDAVPSFEQWRADMELMKELRERSKGYCQIGGGESVGRRGAPGGAGGPSAATSAAGLAPFSAALPLVQGVLGMAATTEAVSPVRGTIEDQAFMNAVAMELRAENVAVLIPETYMPLSLSESNANSPFLSSLNELLTIRACLTTQLAKSEETLPLEKQEIQSDKEAIDVFLTVLTGTLPKQKSEAGANEKKTTNPTSFSPSHLISVLEADGLAQRLRSAGAWQHILWLKALESGGSVTKTGNFLSTKIQYSGGSVGSYALFNLNGDLECSGNVYSYAGPLRAKDFHKEIPLTDFNPIVEQSCQNPSQRLAASTK